MRSTLQDSFTLLSQRTTPPAIKKTGRSSLPAKWSNKMTSSISSIQRKTSTKMISSIESKTTFTVKDWQSYQKSVNHQLSNRCAF